MEIRELSPEKAVEWDTKAKGYDQEISKLTQDVDWAEKATSVEKQAVQSRGIFR